MPTNRVKHFRAQQGWSQRELAGRAGTSQQQIQRIESGKITTGLETANRICRALGQPLEVVFPSAAKALKRLQDQAESTHYVETESLEEVSAGGIEADPWDWSLKVLLEGDREPRIYPISAKDQRRLYRAIQDEPEGDGFPGQFLVFDSGGRRVALNQQCVVFAQLLKDPPSAEIEEEPELPDELVLGWRGGGAPMALEVEPDIPDEDGLGQLGDIFFMLELGMPPQERFGITDADGEHAFIRAGSIAYVELPLHLLPEEGDEDEEEGEDAEPATNRRK